MLKFRLKPPRLPPRPALAMLALLSLLAAVPAHALTAVPRSFDELVQLADTVIIGTVKTVSSEMRDDPAQGIISFVTLDTLQVIKGQGIAMEYTLQMPGGVVDRYAEDYPGLTRFQVGRRYVLFVRGNRRDFFPVVGVTQGVFRVMQDATGREVVVRDDAAAKTRSLNSLTATAPSLAQFVRAIRERLPATDGSP